MIAAPLLILAGLASTPWEPQDAGTAEFLQTMKDNPTKVQVSAGLLHYGYLLLVPMVIGLMALCRPGRLRAVAGTLAFLGVSTIAGAIAVDYFDLTVAQTLPLDQAVAASEHATEMPGALAYFLPGFFGTAVGLPLLSLAAWRSGVVAGWMPLGVLAGVVLTAFEISPAFSIAGAAALLGSLGIAGVLMLRDGAAAPGRSHAPAPA